MEGVQFKGKVLKRCQNQFLSSSQSSMKFFAKELRVVLSNGASLKLESILNQKVPTFPPLDPTNHPFWTGKKKVIKDRGQAAKFYARFGKKEAES